MTTVWKIEFQFVPGGEWKRVDTSYDTERSALARLQEARARFRGGEYRIVEVKKVYPLRVSMD